MLSLKYILAKAKVCITDGTIETILILVFSKTIINAGRLAYKQDKVYGSPISVVIFSTILGDRILSP